MQTIKLYKHNDKNLPADLGCLSQFLQGHEGGLQPPVTLWADSIKQKLPLLKGKLVSTITPQLFPLWP